VKFFKGSGKTYYMIHHNITFRIYQLALAFYFILAYNKLNYLTVVEINEYSRFEV